MFVTKECDYAIRIIRAISDGSYKSTSAIAAAEKIPPLYTQKIATKLRYAGFVKCKYGRKGGIQLARSLNTITLADIIISVDSGRFVSECVCNSSSCPFKSHTHQPCTYHQEFVKAQKMLVSVLSEKTLDVLLASG